MADDPNKQALDRKLVAAGQGYEVREFASKYALTMAEAEDIIRTHGPSRKQLEDFMSKRKIR